MPPRSAAQRQLPFRMRPELTAYPLKAGGRRQWGIKDPFSLRYWQLREEEYWILEKLGQGLSLEAIQAAFEWEFAPRRLSLAHLQAFLAVLHREGLLISESPGQAAVLLERSRRQRWQRFLGAFSNPLAIRFPGVDPDHFLAAIEPFFGGLFTRTSAALVGLLVLSALLLAAIRLEEIIARLPDLTAFFGPGNLIWLAVTIGGMKILHELAHGLACKRFGGECHDMGLMLLVFTPCLYCDVSDAWTLPGKWQRAAIGAAGMYVELALAACATWLWWLSEPGFLNALCLNVMVVCSVSTVIFNGNPLLRYDGYFILADLMDIPNLHQQSADWLRHLAARWFLGIPGRSTRLLPDRHRGFLTFYGIASTLYRWVVVGSILWFLHQVLEPYHLTPVADLLIVLVVAGIIGQPLVRGAAMLANPTRRREIRWPRFLLRAGAVAMILIAAVLIPLPYRISAPALLEPDAAVRVYVTEPGRLASFVPYGETVKTGQTLASLENGDTALELEKLRTDANVLERRLMNLRRRQSQDPLAAAEIPAAEQAVASQQRRLTTRATEAEKLNPTSPAAGIWLTPPVLPATPDEDTLPRWSRRPLESRNLGAYLEPGTWLGSIGDPSRLQAVLVIPQDEVELVRPDQTVRLSWDELPGRIVTGRILEMAEVDLDLTPAGFSSSADLALEADPLGRARPLSTSYQARVALDPQSAPLLIGGTGRARIQAAPQSVLRRTLRFLKRTFRIEW